MGLFIPFIFFGQWTNGNIAPDFTLTDLNGNQHNLYTLLNQGKPVLLDFFFPACAPCWNTTVKHEIKDLYSSYGVNGSDQMRFFALNAWGGPNAVANINGDDITNQNFCRGDFEYNLNFPIIPNDGGYNDLVSIQGFPSYMLVCPNKQAYLISHNNLVSESQSKCGINLVKPSNKLRIYLPEISTCSSSNSVTVYEHLRNTGNNNITSANVKLMVNNSVISSQDLTFNGTNNTDTTMKLADFTFYNAALNQPLGAYGKGPYKIVVDNINGINLTTPIEKVLKIKKKQTATNSTNFVVELKSDLYASETSWAIYNSNGIIVAQNPTIQNSTTSNTNITLANNDCYTLRLKDSYGDGIGSEGYLKLKTSGNVELFDISNGNYSHENFGYDVFHSFYVGTLSNNEYEKKSPKLTITPNPTADRFIINHLQEKSTINITDLSGKLVSTFVNIDSTNIIDVSNLEVGIYLVNINNKDSKETIKFIKE